MKKPPVQPWLIATIPVAQDSEDAIEVEVEEVPRHKWVRLDEPLMPSDIHVEISKEMFKTSGPRIRRHSFDDSSI
jgi:hypothetical protein